MGLVTDVFRGAGNAIFEFGQPFRQDSRRQLADLEKAAEKARADLQRATQAADKFRRDNQLQDEDRAYPRAVQAFELQQKGSDADLERGLRTLKTQGQVAGNLFGTANAGKIAHTQAEYEAQGGLDTTKSSNIIAQERARTDNQLRLQGGSFADLLGGSFGSLDAANRREFIGSMPLAERFDASARDQQTRYLDALKELDERDRPKGLKRFMTELVGPLTQGIWLVNELRG